MQLLVGLSVDPDECYHRLVCLNLLGFPWHARGTSRVDEEAEEQREQVFEPQP